MGKYKVIVGPYGARFWYFNNTIRREEGPAIMHFDGTNEWYSNGCLHRLDGPAIEMPNSFRFLRSSTGYVPPNGFKSWYLNGQYLTEQQHAEMING